MDRWVHNEVERWVAVQMARARRQQWEAAWECYHFNVNRQDRKVTIRNIIALGLPARDAIEMVRDCEQEG
jgi:hypothetical protein